MGWSIDVIRIDLNKQFKEAHRSYRITRPQSAQQAVVIEYSGKDTEDDITNERKRRIAELFPDFVYVEFNLVVVTSEVSDQMAWDLRI